MIKIFAYSAVALLMIAGAFMAATSRKRGGPCRINTSITISEVSFNEFRESIPANGTIKEKLVSADIDEFYFDRIKVGLSALTNNSDLLVSHVDSSIVEGKFGIKLEFKENQQVPPDGQSIRLRIFLSPSMQATLLPVGGFYKDTGGKWILVVKDSLHVAKRHIILGRKNPDYFEVLSGLMPGEKVITSSYENYTDFDFVRPVTLESLAIPNKRGRSWINVLN